MHYYNFRKNTSHSNHIRLKSIIIALVFTNDSFRGVLHTNCWEASNLQMSFLQKSHAIFMQYFITHSFYITKLYSYIYIYICDIEQIWHTYICTCLHIYCYMYIHMYVLVRIITLFCCFFCFCFSCYCFAYTSLHACMRVLVKCGYKHLIQTFVS